MPPRALLKYQQNNRRCDLLDFVSQISNLSSNLVVGEVCRIMTEKGGVFIQVV